jgi:hypothetical protein
VVCITAPSTLTKMKIPDIAGTEQLSDYTVSIVQMQRNLLSIEITTMNKHFVY